MRMHLFSRFGPDVWVWLCGYVEFGMEGPVSWGCGGVVEAEVVGHCGGGDGGGNESR